MPDTDNSNLAPQSIEPSAPPSSHIPKARDPPGWAGLLKSSRRQPEWWPNEPEERNQEKGLDTKQSAPNQDDNSSFFEWVPPPLESSEGFVVRSQATQLIYEMSMPRRSWSVDDDGDTSTAGNSENASITKTSLLPPTPLGMLHSQPDNAKSVSSSDFIEEELIEEEVYSEDMEDVVDEETIEEEILTADEETLDEEIVEEIEEEEESSGSNMSSSYLSSNSSSFQMSRDAPPPPSPRFMSSAPTLVEDPMMAPTSVRSSANSIHKSLGNENTGNIFEADFSGFGESASEGMGTAAKSSSTRSSTAERNGSTTTSGSTTSSGTTSESTRVIYIEDDRDLERIAEEYDFLADEFQITSEDDDYFVPSRGVLTILCLMIVVVAQAIGIALYFLLR